MPAKKKSYKLELQLEKLLEIYKSNRFLEAINLARSIIRKHPTERLPLKVLAASLAQSEKLDEALIVNEKLVLLDPQDPESHINLGVMLNTLGNHEDAEICFRNAKNLHPNSYNVYYNLGYTQRKLQRLNEAVVSFKRSIELKNDYPQAHYNLASTLVELRRFDEAEVYSRAAIALKKDYALAYCNLGHILRRLDKFDQALESYSHALHLNPDFEEALSGRWRLHFEAKDFEAALRDSDRSQLKDSAARSLASLYSLGRNEEIYQRLDSYSKSDDSDISIAAFSAFIANTERRTSKYNFCNNPMDFIYFSNLSAHLKHPSKFITELTGTLDNIPTIWEPASKTTKNGFQSLQDKNLFKDSSEALDTLKSVIVSEIESYLLEYGGHACTFVQKWPSGNQLFGWHVVLKQQGYQGAHIHSGGWLSGVIYLKVVPSLGNNEGAIEFGLNGETYSASNTPKLTYQPKVGDIVFFPSCLHHKTIPFTTETDRIVIAFDLRPNRHN